MLLFSVLSYSVCGSLDAVFIYLSTCYARCVLSFVHPPTSGEHCCIRCLLTSQALTVSSCPIRARSPLLLPTPMSSAPSASDLPRSYAAYDVEDQSGSSSTLLHLSCAACKHYNRHIPLDIPRDESTHVRVPCERCGHSMVGFGRASTQTTLASRDSIPLSISGRVPPLNLKVCTSSLENPTAEHATQTSVPEQLTPLTEHSPLPKSSLSSQSPLKEREELDKERTLLVAKAGTADKEATNGPYSLELSKQGHNARGRFLHLKFGRLRALGIKLRNRLRGKPLSSSLLSSGAGLHLEVAQEGEHHATNATSRTKESSGSTQSIHHAIGPPSGTSVIDRCGVKQDPRRTDMSQSLPPPTHSNLRVLSPDFRLLEGSNVNDTVSKVSAVLISLLR